MKSLYNKLNKHTDYLKRIVPLVLFLIIVPYVSFFTSLTSNDFVYIVYPAVPSFAICFLSFYSIIKISTKFYLPWKEEFTDLELQYESNIEKIKYLFSKKAFWIENTVIIPLYLLIGAIMPTTFIVFSNVLVGVILLVLLIPVFFAVSVAAHLNAFREWGKENVKAGAYSLKKMLGEIAVAAFAYIVGGFSLLLLMQLIFGIVGSMGNAVKLLSGNTLIWLGIISFCIFVLPTVYRYIRAYLKRKSFFKSLQKFCSRAGYTVTETSNIYKSVFSLYSGSNFTVSDGSKTYTCKFICGLKPSIPLLLEENGIGKFLFIFSFAKVEIFSYQKQFRYSFDCDNAKVIIVNPTPKVMYTMKGTQKIPLDNGEKVNGYYVYTGNGFVNALERGCVDGVKKSRHYQFLDM